MTGETKSAKAQGRGAQRVPKRRFRSAILDAALLEFSEKGFHDAQMSEIARRAKVAVGTVYNLFTNKEGLYRELTLEHGREIGAAFNEFLETEGDPLERLLEYVRFKGIVFEENREMIRLFFSGGRGAQMNPRAAVRESLGEMPDQLLLRLAEKFEAAIKNGQLRPLDPFDLAVGLDALTNSFIFLQMDHPDQHPYREKIASILEMFFGPVITDGGRPALNSEMADNRPSQTNELKD